MKLNRRRMLQSSAAALGFSVPLPTTATSASPSADMPYEKKFIEVNGSNMAYVDEGSEPEAGTLITCRSRPFTSWSRGLRPE